MKLGVPIKVKSSQTEKEVDKGKHQQNASEMGHHAIKTFQINFISSFSH